MHDATVTGGVVGVMGAEVFALATGESVMSIVVGDVLPDVDREICQPHRARTQRAALTLPLLLSSVARLGSQR